MRRLLVLALLLSSLGLTTAFAASFTVRTEDIVSFTTPVSITVPGTPLPNTLYLRGLLDDGTGRLELTTPPNNPVESRLIKHDAALGVLDQADPAKLMVWRAPPAPPEGYLLTGTVTLSIDQNGDGNRLTAGLLDCSPDAALNSTSPGCTLFATAVGSEATLPSWRLRTAEFEAVSRIIPAGHELRLKIVNRSPASTADWSVQWGFLPARQSTLQITAP